VHVRGWINLRSFLCLLLQLSNNNLCGGISAQPPGACGRIAGFAARSTASTRCLPSNFPTTSDAHSPEAGESGTAED
jgi:hypothetical protein